MAKMMMGIRLTKFDNYRGIDIYLLNGLFVWFMGKDICSGDHPQTVMNAIEGYWKLKVN